MVSGSKSYASSSPIISAIFNAKKAAWLFSASLSKFDGTLYSFDISSLDTVVTSGLNDRYTKSVSDNRY